LAAYRWLTEAEPVYALLRELREERGLRQKELAARLGERQPYVSRYERGERRLDVLQVRRVCAALGVSFVDFARELERRLTPAT
jgi:transcriptional regulator with XRE-family HTH domain